MGKFGNEYLYSVAASVRGQIGGIGYAGSDSIHDHADPDDDDYHLTFWSSYGQKIQEVVGRMGPPARGRIAVHGLDCGDWAVMFAESLKKVSSSNEALTLLASTVVASAIIDLVRADLKKTREEEIWKVVVDEGLGDLLH